MAITVERLATSDEQQLVRLCRDGDQSAFASIVEAHQAAVFGTILRLARDRALAAELSNRAFYRAYEHLGSFDDSRPLRPWLVRIAANEALNELRSRRRQADRTLGGEAAAIELEQLPGGPDPAELIPLEGHFGAASSGHASSRGGRLEQQAGAKRVGTATSIH